MGSSPDRPGAVRHGTVIAGRYRLDHPLATGGMARVWQATDRVLDRPVAVKVLLDHLAEDRSFVRRFRSEAISAARLTHPSVVSVYDTCSDDGIEAIVMELVDGTTLRRRLDTEGRLAPREAARIAGRIADALAAAHRAGIVHRDIKPANVLLASSGRVVVTDFGIAKASENGDLTAGGQMLGTAKYLAPEQVEGRGVDGRADIYALGVVLFEMLCAKVPFLADTEAATALARLSQPPPRPRDLYPDVPADLDRITVRMLARDPDDRWPDATSLARSLGAFAAGHDVPADPPRPAPTTGPTTRATTGPVTATHPGVTGPVAATGGAPAVDDADDWDDEAYGDEYAEEYDDDTAAPRRGWGPLLAVGVVGVALAIIGLLGWRLLTPEAEPLAVTATAFDPHGTQGENDGDAANAVDGDPATSWSTEIYRDRDITVLKPGVGLVLDLGGPHAVEDVTVTTADDGWSAEVYVITGAPGPDFPGAAEPAAAVTEHDGEATIAVGGVDGDRVVLWITRTGPDGSLTVGEIEVTAS